MLKASQIDWVILAGGRATRMGGQDKGLIMLNQEPMISHILHHLSPQTDSIYINANRNLETYQKYAPVFSDESKDFAGPLAGMLAGLKHAGEQPWVGFIPCDGPNIPADLAERFVKAYQDANQSDAQILVAHDGDFYQPVFTLFRRDLLPKLEAFLASGQRKIIDLYKDATTIEVDFSDARETFINLNTQEDVKNHAEVMRSVQARKNRDAQTQTMIEKLPTPILGFAAYSGTGKTTLLEQLLPKLTAAGLKIGMFKHAHHAFDVDKPGKDSYRLRKAGAGQMLIASRNRYVLMTETPEAEAQFVDLLDRFDHQALDLILVEGCKNLSFPKIELHREALDKPWLYPFDPNIIAVCHDSQALPHPFLDKPLPELELNDLDPIAAFIQDWAKQSKSTAAPACVTSKQTVTAQNAAPSTSNQCDVLSPAFLSVAEGRERILQTLAPIAIQKAESLALEQSYHRHLATDIFSPLNVPAHTNSAMDGYAVRSEDFVNLEAHSDGLTFECIGTVFAGQMSDKLLGKNQALKIMTGAPMPQGADTVIMRELADLQGDRVTFSEKVLPFKAGQHVRQAGEDLAKDALVFAQGTQIASAQMGMLASLGIAHVEVRAKLKVAIFSTGDEVTAPGQPLANASIYDANRYSLTGQLQRLGCDVIDLGIIEDNQASIENTLTKASEQADLILSSGGVSVGDADYIKAALDKLGQIDFWRINMRPGRPLAFGHLHTETKSDAKSVPFFGLPGNPVATLIAFLTFVEPAIYQLQGRSDWQENLLPAIAQEDLRSRVGRTEFSRGFYALNSQGQLVVKSTGSQGSGILRSMHEANCIIQIAPEVEKVKAGEIVMVMPLSGKL